MTEIQLLEDNVINKIAAGEVVERPSSVLKELVENAIDAGALNIVVEIEEGGRKKIIVADDGKGMEAEDCFLAVRRHATSKISSSEDLFNIQSMGFRGEALASIAAVSRFSLMSCKKNQDTGCRIDLEGGTLTKNQEWKKKDFSTRIVVKDLFFNIPVRSKFLRNPQTEYSYCLELLQAIALSRPSHGIQFIHNNKSKMDISGSIDERSKVSSLNSLSSISEQVMRKRYADIFGVELSEKLLYFYDQSEYGAVAGLISPPGYEKASGKKYVHFC